MAYIQLKIKKTFIYLEHRAVNGMRSQPIGHLDM
jgi:hypothetical protein